MNDKNRNLAVRVTTALVLLPIVLVCIWQGGGGAFAVLVSVAAAACALELNFLPWQLPAAPPETFKQAIASEVQEIEGESALITGAGLASLLGAFLLPFLAFGPLPWLAPEAVLSAVAMLSLVDALLFERELSRAPQRVALAVLGVVYPGLLLASLVRLRQLPQGGWWILLAVAVTWMNDTGAYFAGRAFGRRKLYPRISPSKTWEGAIGGALGSIAAALAVQQLGLPDLPAWGAALVGLGAAVLGPLGDLSESMLKRAYGVKDSGRLLPGHGGFLDRIDALLFTGPFVLLCARLLHGPT